MSEFPRSLIHEGIASQLKQEKDNTTADAARRAEAKAAHDKALRQHTEELHKVKKGHDNALAERTEELSWEDAEEEAKAAKAELEKEAREAETQKAIADLKNTLDGLTEKAA